MLLEGSNASTALTWVRPDLDKHLTQIRTQIEHIAGSTILGSGVESTAEHLIQLKYTFEALVLQGATMVVEEMITVCDELRRHNVRDRKKAFGAMMDAIVVLPSYLDRLQAGHHDLPVLLLPVINELRAAYNANIVSEATLFTPDLNVPLPELDRKAVEHEPVFDEPFHEFALRMRRQWENALLRWLQRQENVELLAPLHEVCESLYCRLERIDLRRLWWIAHKVIGGLLDGVTGNDMHLRRLFARLHLILKTLSEGGEEATDVNGVNAVSQALLFHIAQAKSGNPGVDNLRDLFQLQELVPDRDVLIRARGAVTGRNRELYISLGAAVRDELSLVKDALDLELRTGEIEPTRRKNSQEALLRLKDTLKMLGLGDSAQSIAKLLPAFDASEDPVADPQQRSRKTLLLSLAGELIKVESDLEEQIATLGEPILDDQESNFIDLPRHEQRRIRAHLLDETVVSLHQVQDGVRRHFDGDEKADYTSPMEHIAGALELIGESDTARLALKLRNALGNLLRLARSESAVDPVKLETVTDAVAAFELYLAGCRDQQSNRGRFLEILKDRLERLPIGEMEVVKTSSLQASIEKTSAKVVTAKETSASAVSTSAVPPTLDPELLEVFLEEYEAVASMLKKRIPEWMQQQEDRGLVTEIRRGFHTLKGSGRMVGAFEIGDFAWQIEALINTFLEGSITATDDVVAIVRLSEAALPAMEKRLRKQPSEPSSAAIEAIALQANNITTGKSADWMGLLKVLPVSFIPLLPGIESAQNEEAVGLTLKDLLIKELTENLSVLKGLMDSISRDRSHTASDDEIRAVHTIAGTTALDPLGDESGIARALEHLFETQRDSGKAFSSNAMWMIATSLAYFETCLAIHEGAQDVELAGQELNQVEQLIALTAEYEVPGEAAEATFEPPDTEEDEPAEIEPEPVDTEILSIFLEEATDILERCDSLLNSWRDNLPELRIVQNLQREIHTFKGGARMAGIDALASLSHAMETLLENIAGQLLPPSNSAIDVLEQGCDRLNVWTEQASRGVVPQAGAAVSLFEQQVKALTAAPAATADKTDTDVSSSHAQASVALEPASKSKQPESVSIEDSADLQATESLSTVAAPPAEEMAEEVAEEVVHGETASVETRVDAAQAQATTIETPAIAAKPVRIEPVAEDLQEIPDVVIPATQAGVSAEPSEEPAGSQHIRVSAELLDSLVNSAGEISIFRSLLEQQVGYIRENLKELDVTVSRLREQFRKLEIETETQIRSRYQQDIPGASEEFDPLEMDRFSPLQQLSRSLAESVSDLLNLQELLSDGSRKSDALLVQQSRVSAELQAGLMQTRMVHFGTIAPRLRRIIRTAAGETHKNARLQLRMTGGGDQLDRNVLERITAPLEHLLRNAIVHGIESPGIRRKLNKPKEGQLSITVAAEATEFVVQVSDDGAGLNLKAIHKRAIELGLLDQAANLPPKQLFKFILHSGFSTSKTVTALAGRGVGMDVVNSEIKQIGGSVEIDSTEGKGSCFTIRIPFTLAIMQVLGVMVGEHRYMIPLAAVAGVTRILPAVYQNLLGDEKPVYQFAGEDYSILELEPLLGEPTTPLGDETISMLMIKTGEQRAAFRVPELLGHREIVIKPVGPQISSVPGILGGTITGDGRVVIIIDIGPLIRHALLTGARPASPLESADILRHKALALVVDDSITMRKVTARVMEGNDFEVITARDGVDATEKMRERVPDILLLDVEMPRMDGYQVAEYVRGDARLRHIPIVMITSRAGKKHRDRGMEAGADVYLSKPYKESELIAEVERLMRTGRQEHG